MPQRIPHQLSVTVDHVPPDQVLVTWDYRYAGDHAIPSQAIRLRDTDLPPFVAAALDALFDKIRGCIEVQPVRLPHREVMPVVQQAVTTLVLQDQVRADQLPLVRMYYLERVEATQTQVERQVRLEPKDFDREDRSHLRVVKDWAKRVAWDDYQSRFAT